MALWNGGGGGGAFPAAAVLVAAAVAALLGAGVATNKFDDVVQPSWANDHVVYDGDLLKLRLDANSGGGFVSRSKFLYGKASADLKLVPGDSAGVVTAFYVSECRHRIFALLCFPWKSNAATSTFFCAFILHLAFQAWIWASVHFLLLLWNLNLPCVSIYFVCFFIYKRLKTACIYKRLKSLK
jgi:hypothetical protein